MTEPTLVDIYCRVATTSPDGNIQLDKQEEACRQYCLGNGLTISAVRREVWAGSQYRERVELTRMRARYRQGKIQGVVITTLDRLSRSQVHLIILLNEMQQHNTTLYTVKEKMDETALGRLVMMIAALTAEVERKKALDKSLSTPQHEL